MTKEEAIMVLKNEQPHCGKKALFPEEKKYEAYDVAIKALEQEPCDDCVRRREVLDVLKDKWNMFSDANDAMQESINAIKALKPVTPKQEPKTGHWIEVTNGRGGHECDLCHEYAPSYKDGDERLTKYCPSCGADMREVEE